MNIPASKRYTPFNVVITNVRGPALPQVAISVTSCREIMPEYWRIPWKSWRRRSYPAAGARPLRIRKSREGLVAAADSVWPRSGSAKIGPPSRLLLMLEARALSELGAYYLARPLLAAAPRGDGHPVLVLPGFLASDFSTTPLRSFLSSRGYAVEGWKLGRNLGAAGLEDRLLERVAGLRRLHGRKVSLVGWSLGGIFAREIARLASDDVRSVITLGSPFNHNPRANHSWRLFEYLSGRTIDGIDPTVMAGMREPPPVPATAIYSRSDGIAAWQCCVEREGPRSESIEVEGSHLGLGHNPLVLHAVADRLAQPDGAWRRFERSGLRRYFYRDPLR